MFMDFDHEAMYFSLTGHYKKENLRRDPRACVAISKPFRSTAHLMIWGRMEMHEEPEYQDRWREMVTKWMGAEGKTVPRDRPLAWELTSFGIFTPYRWRIFGLD
jgi:general stress protein 26